MIAFIGWILTGWLFAYVFGTIAIHLRRIADVLERQEQGRQSW